jgi:ABC-type oligopeptide transport system substrate-binding subunit
MPDGSSSAAPVTNPGPSSRNKIFRRLAGAFFSSAAGEFMVCSSNKSGANCKIFVLRNHFSQFDNTNPKIGAQLFQRVTTA